MATIIDVDADTDTPRDVADAHLLAKELAGGCKVKVVYGATRSPGRDGVRSRSFRVPHGLLLV